MPQSAINHSRSSKPSATATLKTASTSHTTAKATDAPQRLKDGDQIRLRQTRRGLPPRQKTSSVGDGSKDAAGVAKSPKNQKTKKPKKTAPKKPSKLRQKIANSVKKSAHRHRVQKLTRADLINAESRLGSKIFGPIPEGHRREFFHDQQNIWIWHESWLDDVQHHRQMTVRYEVRPSGVYKKLSAGRYVKLEGDELENFRRATHAYLRTIKQNLYHRA